MAAMSERGRRRSTGDQSVDLRGFLVMLKAAAGADRAGLVDLSALRQQLDSAVAPGQYVEYRWAHDYAEGIHHVLDDIEHLTSQGFPESAIEAVEYALELLDEAIGRVDDSDGWLGKLFAARRRSTGKLARPPGRILHLSESTLPSGPCARNGRCSSTPRPSTPTSSARKDWPASRPSSTTDQQAASPRARTPAGERRVVPAVAGHPPQGRVGRTTRRRRPRGSHLA
jgi:pyruvate/2-oxoglutarate dehydrogenase complex dihydrolipoamide acyltransferase (E2) component